MFGRLVEYIVVMSSNNTFDKYNYNQDEDSYAQQQHAQLIPVTLL